MSLQGLHCIQVVTESKAACYRRLHVWCLSHTLTYRLLCYLIWWWWKLYWWWCLAYGLLPGWESQHHHPIKMGNQPLIDDIFCIDEVSCISAWESVGGRVYNSGPKPAGVSERKNSNPTIYRAIWTFGHYLGIIPARRVYLQWDNAPFWYYLAGIIIPCQLENTVVEHNNYGQ